MTETKKNKGSKKTPFLQTNSPVRSYDRSELAEIFEDMKSEMNPPKAGGFYHAVTSIGTHAPKLASARNKTQALQLNTGSGNRASKLAASGNGSYSQYMKLLLRPILLVDEVGQPCLFERLQAGDLQMLDAFEEVFGADARLELEKGLFDRTAAPMPAITHENYPVFFLPGENGGDLQASPGGSIEAHVNMNNLMSSMLSKAKMDRSAKKPATYGEWSVLSLVAKTHIVIVGGPGSRTRFHASFPCALSELEADIWRYRKTGQFPPLRDREAANAFVEFALACQRFDDRDTYRGGDIKERQVDNRAKFLILRARCFIEDIYQALLASGVDKQDLPSPDIRNILSRLNIRSALAARTESAGMDVSNVIASLRHPDFGYALQKHGQ